MHSASFGGPPTGGPFRCYRVADGAFPLLEGAGAARFGGRWNSPGRVAVDASRSYANALLNPAHAAFWRVVAGGPEPVAWDTRLWEPGMRRRE